MRVLTWNLNHRARKRRIADWIAEAVVEQRPDIVVLTEYVEGDDHAKFLDKLGADGLAHSKVSPSTTGHNQVLIAARSPLAIGSLRPDLNHPAVAPNFLHVRTEEGIDVLGFRMPTPLRLADGCSKRQVWEWLIESAQSVADRPAVLIGDFNTALNDAKGFCGDCVAALPAQDWRHAQPATGFSWTTGKPGGERRIDHAFLSLRMRAASAQYLWDFRKYPNAASARVGIPDHAMLVVDVAY